MSRDPLLVVVGEGATSDSAVRLTAELLPDVLVLDVELGGVAARTTISTVGRMSPLTKVVMLTMHRDSILRKELLRSGASDYITKSAPAEQLLNAIHSSGNHVRVDTYDGAELALLSSRQHEVLVQMALARSNRAIADALGIAEGTIKRHANELFKKLEVTSRMDAVRRARLLGLIP